MDELVALPVSETPPRAWRRLWTGGNHRRIYGNTSTGVEKTVQRPDWAGED